MWDPRLQSAHEAACNLGLPTRLCRRRWASNMMAVERDSVTGIGDFWGWIASRVAKAAP